MTLTVKQSRRVVEASGTTTTLTHDFPLEDVTFLHVYADEVELVLGVDYTVSGIGDPAGYTVTISNPTGWTPNRWVLHVVYPVNQPSDVDQGGQFGKRFEDALDRFAIILQSLNDFIRRTPQLALTTALDINVIIDEPEADSVIGWDETGTRWENKGSVPQIQTVAQYVQAIKNVSDEMPSILTVEANLPDLVTVSDNIIPVVAAGSNIGSVITVASNISSVNTVSLNISSVNTVASSIANVNAVGTSIADVNTVAGSVANVNTVAGSITNVNNVGGSIDAVNNVNGSLADVETVAANIAAVNTTAGSIADVNTLADNIADVNTVAGNSANINAVAANEANINTVAGLTAEIAALPGQVADAQQAASDASDSAGSASDSAQLAQSVTANMTGGTTGQLLVKNSNADYDYTWQTPAGSGDMLRATYDPQNISADAFDRSNHTGAQAMGTVAGLTEILSGGTAGQVLRKVSGTDYDTEWSDGEFVSYSAQSLSPEQQAQARENIGITGDGGAYVTPQDFGASGDGSPGDGAAFAAMMEELEGRGGGLVILPQGVYDISDVDRVVVPSNVSLYFQNAKVRHTGVGNKSAFVCLEGTENVIFGGIGEIVGPAENRTPDTTNNYQLYPNQNAGIKLLGRWTGYEQFDRPVRNVIIDSNITIWGWDVSGVFSEATDNFRFYGKIRKCGVDGIRDLGSRNHVFDGFDIRDLGPGKDGNAPYFNAYGITTSRRPQITNVIATPETVSTWQMLGFTATDGSSTNPYTGSDFGVLMETATTGIHTAQWSHSASANGVWFGSVVLEPNGRDYARVTLVDASSSTSFVRIQVRISTGEILRSGVLGTGQLLGFGSEQLGPNRWRFWLYGVITDSTSAGNARIMVQALDGAGYTLTSGGTYAGNAAMGIKATALQMVQNAYNTSYGPPLTVNPAPSNWKMINGRVDNCPSWTGLDSHGGVDGVIANNVVTRCAFGIKTDGGNTSGGADDGPTRGIKIVNNIVDGTGSALPTRTGIALHSTPTNRATDMIVDGNTVRGFGATSEIDWEAGIKISACQQTVVTRTNTIEGCRKYGLLFQYNCDLVLAEDVQVRTMIHVDSVGVPVFVRPASGGYVTERARIMLPRRIGSVTAEFVTNGGAWCEDGFYTAANRPSPPQAWPGHAPRIYDSETRKPLWYAGSNWRDATGEIV